MRFGHVAFAIARKLARRASEASRVVARRIRRRPFSVGHGDSPRRTTGARVVERSEIHGVEQLAGTGGQIARARGGRPAGEGRTRLGGQAGRRRAQPARLPLSTVDTYAGGSGASVSVSYQLSRCPRSVQTLSTVVSVASIRAAISSSVDEAEVVAPTSWRSSAIAMLVGDVRCATRMSGVNLHVVGGSAWSGRHEVAK
jgi:hypothetical protein